MRQAPFASFAGIADWRDVLLYSGRIENREQLAILVEKIRSQACGGKTYALQSWFRARFLSVPVEFSDGRDIACWIPDDVEDDVFDEFLAELKKVAKASYMVHGDHSQLAKLAVSDPIVDYVLREEWLCVLLLDRKVVEHKWFDEKIWAVTDTRLVSEYGAVRFLRNVPGWARRHASYEDLMVLAFIYAYLESDYCNTLAHRAHEDTLALIARHNWRAAVMMSTDYTKDPKALKRLVNNAWASFYESYAILPKDGVPPHVAHFINARESYDARSNFDLLFLLLANIEPSAYNELSEKTPFAIRHTISAVVMKKPEFLVIVPDAMLTARDAYTALEHVYYEEFANLRFESCYGREFEYCNNEQDAYKLFVARHFGGSWLNVAIRNGEVRLSASDRESKTPKMEDAIRIRQYFGVLVGAPVQEARYYIS